MNAARTSPFRDWCAAAAAMLSLLGCSWCAAVEAGADERSTIARERNAAEADFAARSAECQRRFIVSSCLEEARSKRREALDGLRSRQLVVDEERRRMRAEARRVDLAARSASDAVREQELVGKAARAASSASASSAPREAGPDAGREGRSGVAGARPMQRERVGASSASSASAAVKRRAQEAVAQRRAGESSKSAAFDARKREAAQHRDDVLDATTRRMLQRSPAPSLPPPAAPAHQGASAP